MNNVTQQQLVEYAEAFEVYDTEGEGTVPIDSIDCIIQTLGESVPAAALLQMKQRKVDEGESSVSFTEFLHLIVHGRTEGELEEHTLEARAGNLREALQLFDPAQTGFISAVDFRKVMRDSLKDAEIDALVRKADPTQTGKIAYDGLISEMTGF